MIHVKHLTPNDVHDDSRETPEARDVLCGGGFHHHFRDVYRKTGMDQCAKAVSRETSEP